MLFFSKLPSVPADVVVGGVLVAGILDAEADAGRSLDLAPGNQQTHLKLHFGFEFSMSFTAQQHLVSVTTLGVNKSI